MWRFCPLFSSIAMVWWIMKSCYKVVRLIINTTLKLCADCATQFVRNAQNWGKTKHEFFFSSHIDACEWVFGQKQNRNHATTTVFTGLGLRRLFPLPKTERPKTERRGKESVLLWLRRWKKIETELVGDIKKPVSEVFRGLEKTLA